MYLCSFPNPWDNLPLETNSPHLNTSINQSPEISDTKYGSFMGCAFKIICTEIICSWTGNLSCIVYGVTLHRAAISVNQWSSSKVYAKTGRKFLIWWGRGGRNCDRGTDVTENCTPGMSFRVPLGCSQICKLCGSPFNTRSCHFSAGVLNIFKWSWSQTLGKNIAPNADSSGTNRVYVVGG